MSESDTLESETLAAGHTVMPIVRVAVLATGGTEGDRGSRVTDMALPTELPLREILPAVRRMAAPNDDSSEAASTSGPTQLSLAPIGGAPFSLDATLDTVGVVDGDLLALQAIPRGPAAPRIVEDIADAAVIFSAARDKPWGPAHIERAAGLAVMGLILLATVVGTVHRVATGEYAGLFTVSGVAALTVLASLLTRARSPRLATALAVTALAPVAAAFALTVPGDFSASSVLLAAAGVTAWSIIGITVTERAIAVFTAATVVGFGTLLTAAAAAIWELNTVAVGSALLLIAILTTVQAARLSALWARFPAPAIPAPGDPVPSAPSLKVLADLPRRVRVSDSHQTGFIAGGVLLAIAGSLFLVVPQGVSPWAWYVVAAASLGAALRARVWDSASCKAWLLSQPYLMALALAVVFLIDGRHVGAWWALGALAVMTLVWAVGALSPRVASPDTYSLPMRRLVGFLATALDASLIPVLAYLVGVFTWVLNR
jgi:type VII secretion integral membrane protein EccD